jgi:hypothetical protein
MSQGSESLKLFNGRLRGMGTLLHGVIADILSSEMAGCVGIKEVQIIHRY